MEFEGKNILVVGGTSGIGKSLVEKLKNAGANVINASRSEAAGVDNIPLDVTEDFQKIDDLPDQLDGLVYCPGSINLKPFQSLKPEDYREDFNLNVVGGLNVVKASLKSLKKSKSASIIFFSTVAVTQGMSFHTSVAAAKGALEGVTRSLAAEFARQNIRVNAIAPSLTDTPMAKSLLSSDDKRKASEERHPLKRVGAADEMADAALYLLSDATAWMTGQILHLDGGMSSIRPL